MFGKKAAEKLDNTAAALHRAGKKVGGKAGGRAGDALANAVIAPVRSRIDTSTLSPGPAVRCWIESSPGRHSPTPSVPTLCEVVMLRIILIALLGRLPDRRRRSGRPRSAPVSLGLRRSRRDPRRRPRARAGCWPASSPGSSTAPPTKPATA
jgi:hypothetical protein